MTQRGAAMVLNSDLASANLRSPPAPAVTVRGSSVFSDMESTDGTRSHRKYVVDNVIVHRGVYRDRFFEKCAYNDSPFNPATFNDWWSGRNSWLRSRPTFRAPNLLTG